ncbi:MAG: DUF1329 domain-containing protein [Rhodobiaceae bacterium]|nr:hypothetical protein RHODOSMS8_02301 [Rhodobiaceae bacterium]MCR9241853.1 DUF1329 domain-containing protein [Rhodobiaceae bacterium]
MKILSVSLAAGLCWSGAAVAGVSESEAARLGQDLTPIGAEMSGNADGSIPAWAGGLTSVPDGVAFVRGHYPDPFTSDAPIATITSANAEEHASLLTDGQRAMLDRYPSYKMDVYETRRTCAFPEAVYDATRANAINGSISDDGRRLSGVALGVPFPIPQSGVELVWNHNLRFRGHKVRRTFASAAPSRTGAFTPIRVQDELVFSYADPTLGSIDELDNVSLKYIQETLSPARRAGQLLLVHETIDPSVAERISWQYTVGRSESNPNVQRTTAVSYDNPQIYSDAMSTADNFDMFSGPPDRYDWTLLGKEEKYIAYNSYRLSSPTLTYGDIVQAGHLNQDHVRYERHRVWAVEATLKPTTRHVYSRRTNYFDEDSWNLASSNLYDARGGLWRVQEAHLMQYYDVPTCFNASDVVYDLIEGRYVVQNLKNEENGIDFAATDLLESQFVPQELRRRVTRR